MNPFTLVLDLLDVSRHAIHFFSSAQPLLFLLVLLLSLALSLAVASALPGFCRKVNRQFSFATYQRLGLGLAVLVSCLLITSIPSFSKLADVIVLRIRDYRSATSGDSSLSQRAFVDGYKAAKATGRENFSGYPPPEAGGRIIPMNHPETRLAVGLAYARAAQADFEDTFPFEARYLGDPSRDLAAMVRQDIQDFFKTATAKIYPLERAIDLVLRFKEQDAIRKVPQVIQILQLLALLSVLILWALVYLAYAWWAYGLLNRNHSEGVRVNSSTSFATN